MSAEECDGCGVRTDWGFPVTLTEYTGLMNGTVALCDDCWTDDGKILAMIAGTSGCCLHLVVDDHNLEDDSIRFCLKYAADNHHTFCRFVGERLLAMSARDRYQALGARPICRGCGDAEQSFVEVPGRPGSYVQGLAYKERPDVLPAGPLACVHCGTEVTV